MKKHTTISYLLVTITIVVTIIILGIYKITSPKVEINFSSNQPEGVDVKNINYVIDSENFLLKNGVATKEIAPGSKTVQTVRMFGEPVYGDLNGDSKKDAAVMLVSNSGGSGTFYYAVLAIATGTTYKATNALILGDRIAPQTVEIKEGRALYNYAERKSTDPMTTQPSIGKSLWIHYNNKTNEIGEFVKNFEGEADTSRMTLSMNNWRWVKTQMNDGKIILPKKEGVFTLSFKDGGIVKIGTDCNSMSAEYIVKGNKITFDRMISTKMACENSQEQEFSGTLSNISSYMFTSKGELVLEIKMDSGVMIFR